MFGRSAGTADASLRSGIVSVSIRRGHPLDIATEHSLRVHWKNGSERVSVRSVRRSGQHQHSDLNLSLDYLVSVLRVHWENRVKGLQCKKCEKEERAASESLIGLSGFRTEGSLGER